MLRWVAGESPDLPQIGGRLLEQRMESWATNVASHHSAMGIAHPDDFAAPELIRNCGSTGFYR